MIYLAADHRGFELKEKIKEWLKEWGYEYEDMGAFEFDKDDDYPDFIHKAAERVSQDPDNSRAIIMGGSGQGEAMAANRYKGVRAAVFYGPPFQLKLVGWRVMSWFTYEYVGLIDSFARFILKKLVKLSREHNNANVLSLAAAFINYKMAKIIIKLWLETPFSEDERHIRRISKL